MNNNAKNHIRKNRLAYILGTVAVLLIIIVGIGYNNGYRLVNNFKIGKIGYLKMDMLLPETSVYVDQDEEAKTSGDNQSVNIPLSPKEHTVIVSKQGYFPWTQDVNIPSDGTITLYPIFVAQNTSGQIITNKDKEYSSIRFKIITAKIPTKTTPVVSKDGTEKVWIEDNAIMVKKDNQITKLLQPDTVVRNVDFYKDRSDAVIFATQNGVYVIEINSPGSQNFMPIYKGQTPTFIKVDANSIYILDIKTLLQVII